VNSKTGAKSQKHSSPTMSRASARLVSGAQTYFCQLCNCFFNGNSGHRAAHARAHAQHDYVCAVCNVGHNNVFHHNKTRSHVTKLTASAAAEAMSTELLWHEQQEGDVVGAQGSSAAPPPIAVDHMQVDWVAPVSESYAEQVALGQLGAVQEATSTCTLCRSSLLMRADSTTTMTM
jgi:hypothetical protein